MNYIISLDWAVPETNRQTLFYSKTCRLRGVLFLQFDPGLAQHFSRTKVCDVLMYVRTNRQDDNTSSAKRLRGRNQNNRRG